MAWAAGQIAGNAILGFTNAMVSGTLPGAGGRTPVRGIPNSKVCYPDGKGGHTEREYGPDGKAKSDTDYGHSHDAGDPHTHTIGIGAVVHRREALERLFLKLLYNV